MADMNCKACEDLLDEVPGLIANGFSNTMCASLKNDTGLKASSGNNDCTDLDNLNDCLVGNMETEVEKYDVCDWKKLTKELIGNLWTTNKGIICAVCGLWTNVHNLWTAINSFCLTKTGDKINLTNSQGVLCSVTDEDTWQANTASQEGYVKKGENDGHSVWATNASGSPDWRSSVTLDGSLTLYDHDGQIGETKWWQLDSPESIMSGETMMIDTGITLTKGKWICVATIGYQSDSTGDRSIGLSFGNAGHHKGSTIAAASSASETILTKTYIRTVSDSNEKVYLDAHQNSGANLDITVYPNTYVNCIRIC